MKQQMTLKEFAQGLGGLAVIAFVLYLIFGGSNDTDKKPKVLSHEERIKQQFNAWDGSHQNLTALVKKGMNDPNSYENVETTYFDRDSLLIVNQQYTGKNAFGGRVRGFVKAKVDTLGNVLEILEEQ